MMALRAELVEIKSLIEENVAAGKAAETQGVISRISNLLGKLKRDLG